MTQTLVLATIGAPSSPPISKAIMQPTSSTGSTSTPSKIRKITACAMVGSEWPTSIVCGISRSGTSLRNLNQAVVGAKEPMPSVSKKLVSAPSTRLSPVGRAAARKAARPRIIANAAIARPSGIKSAISMAAPFAMDVARVLDECAGPGYGRPMLDLDDQQQAARDWFESLRDRICSAFEAIEREAGSNAAFDYIGWDRTEDDGTPGGGGVRGQMAGKVFDKVGVNVSTVGGRFSPEFAQSIPGAEDDPSFFATGISLVAHMANPHVPAVHMNTRFLTTTRRWFGGGADLNPAIPYRQDTEAFHARLRAACAAHDPTFYPRFSKWAEEYFWLPHRHVARGVGGIFFDRLEDHFDAHFAFTRDVGEAFLDIFPEIVRKRMATPFNDEDMEKLLTFRGRYVEFNLLYDRGTLFGLKTGGNIDAILMSLPPLAKWA